ncbi:PLA2G3 [Branchiostoma lanceolatum]|uniref:PLA2G3 protein n=1 Tax=Branchiostoma lanceolatum TaxID=7740 RepID=A0A8J9VNB0_BRALA|nr:PLA2G3 [Branchiostoma lanceolatum]
MYERMAWLIFMLLFTFCLAKLDENLHFVTEAAQDGYTWRLVTDGQGVTQFLLDKNYDIVDCNVTTGGTAKTVVRDLFREAVQSYSGIIMDQHMDDTDHGRYKRRCTKFLRDTKRIKFDTTAPLYHERMRRGKFHSTWPGTKWCGTGQAPANTTLGKNNGTDNCCQQHKQCADVLEGYQRTDYFQNMRPWRISHCDCDRQLYDCLAAVNTSVSYAVAFTYFHDFNPTCFERRRKEICTEHDDWFNCKKQERVKVPTEKHNPTWPAFYPPHFSRSEKKTKEIVRPTRHARGF